MRSGCAVLGSLVVGVGRLVGWVAGVVVVLVLLVGGGCAWATTGHSFAGGLGGGGGGEGRLGEDGSGPPGVAGVAGGDVFTADRGRDGGPMVPRVQRFSADGVFESSFLIDASPINVVGPIAVDPSGAVYVSVNQEPGPLAAVEKYTAAGEFAYELVAPA